MMTPEKFALKLEALGFRKNAVCYYDREDLTIFTKPLTPQMFAWVEGPRIDIFNNPDKPGEWRIGYFENGLDACGNAFSVFDSDAELLIYLHGAWGTTEAEIQWDALARWLQGK